jgi:hypothetical protein
MTMVEGLRIAQQTRPLREASPPKTWVQVAKIIGLPERTCRRTFDNFMRSIATLGDGSGIAVLDETLLLYGEQIEDLAWLAANGDQDSVRVAAHRSLDVVLRERIELLTSLGRMPRNFRATIELVLLQQFARRMASVVEKHELPTEVIAEFIEIAEEIQPIIDGTARALNAA